MGFSLEISAVLGLAVAYVFWLARLEFMTKQAKEEIDLLKSKHEYLNTDLRNELSKVSSSLARIEGKLSVHNYKQGG